MKTFTKSWLSDNRDCYSPEKLAACSFMQTEGDITLRAILESEIRIADRFWFLCHKVLSQQENQLLAIECAEAVLPIWEAKYPDDLRPRKVIEVARQCLAEGEKVLVDVAYDDAYDAARAAVGTAVGAAYTAALAAIDAADAAADRAAFYTAYAAARAAFYAAYAAVRATGHPTYAAAAYATCTADRAAYITLESILNKYAEKYY